MTLQSEDMGKLVAGNLGRVWIGQWLRHIMRDFRPAHREAQPETDGGLIERLCVAMLDGVGCTPWDSPSWDQDGTDGASRQGVRDSVKRILAALASNGV